MSSRSKVADAPGGVAKAQGEGVDARVAQVLDKTIGIDMHNHVYPSGTEPQRGGGGGCRGRGGGPGSPPQQEQGQRQSQGDQQQARDLSLSDELRRSGLSAVCASFVLDFAPNEKPGDALSNYLNWLTAIDAALEKAASAVR